MRKLDALAAERVMGHPDICFYRDDYFGAEGDWPVPHYSEDIAAAWELVENIPDISNNRFQLSRKPNAYMAWFGSKFGAGKTAPLAITIAALKAVGTPQELIDEALK